jgi:predicted ATPase/DNA-binding winged helix-turn-helix (wHTH) protein
MHTMAAPAAIRFGPFELDLSAEELRRANTPVPLRARPMALLRVFVQRPGALITKDELLDAAWPGLVVEENNLQVQVSVLRKLLGASAIATVAGRGYRFTQPVESAATTEAPATVPQAADRLFGRADDLAYVLTLLREARLVTIIGPGGVGKTRLAHAAAQSAGPVTVHWVDLAALADASLVAARAIELVNDGTGTPEATPQAASRDAVAWLAERLEAQKAWLVLDNAEHVLEAVARLADTLMRHTRHSRVLVTSQAPLRLPSEHVLRLSPLALPLATATLDDARENGAVALFAQRAAAADARWRFDDSTLPAVVEICRRLDGLPLALELAAARVPAFGLRRVAALLDERFQLLNAGYRHSPPRQQTLRAVYEWTCALLDESELKLFRRLGVLAGPLPLPELVELLQMTDEGDLEESRCYDTLAALVERSLLHTDDADPPCYRVLESTRDYAMSLLRAAGELKVLAHASAWYERAGDRASQAVSGTPALLCYGTALELLQQLPPGPERDERELRLALKLGPAIQSTLGPAHARCEAVYRRSVELARGMAPGAVPFQAVWGYWQFLSLAGRDREAAPYAREIVDMAPALNDDGLQLEALHAEMTSADLLGDAPAVLAHAERITAMYDRCRHHRLTFAFGGHDPGVCALGQGSVNLWLCGEPEKAAAMAQRALDLAATLDHGYSRATAAFYAAITFAALGDRAALTRTADALVRLSDEYGMAMLLTEGRFFTGCARFADGDAQGLVQMGEALQAIEASRDLAFVFVYMALYAEALLASGDADAVLALVERALGYATWGQGLFLPELLRLRALARKALDDAGWRDDVQEADRMARAQGAVTLARRASASLNV